MPAAIGKHGASHVSYLGPFSAVGLVAVSPIALAIPPPLVSLAGALDVSVSVFVYSRDGRYGLLVV